VLGGELRSKDVEIYVAFDLESGTGAFLPPVILRELAWRKASAGEPLSEADGAKFTKSGLKTVPGMKIYDCVRNIEHALKHGLNMSLAQLLTLCVSAVLVACDAFLSAARPGGGAWGYCSG
jgi:hypothetical protein